jgi:hypothetical protein
MQIQATKHKGDERRFSIMSQSWYADSNMDPTRRAAGEDEIMLGFYSPDGGTSGEFAIRWEILNGAPIARLKAYEDSWSALANFGDVLQKLAELDSTNPSVETVAQVLKNCGIVDATPRVSPYGSRVSRVQDNIESLAGVLTLFQDALDKLREMGRKASGDAAWATGVESGKKLKAVDGITQQLFEETQQIAVSVQIKRDKLREAVLKFPDMAEKYKGLLNDSAK